MRVNTRGPGRPTVRLNGALIEDCMWYDVEAGECEVLERHWSTGEIVREADGTPRSMILKGFITTEEPAVAPETISELHDFNQPCPCCGGSCPPGGCWSCC